MATREDLQDWLTEALTVLGGRGSIVEVCKQIWEHHESDLRASSDLFYTWQYDVRWAANRLRLSGRMKSVEQSDPHVWELVPLDAKVA
jgi:ribulose kinase